MSPTVKNVLLLLVLVGALGTAGYMFISRSSEDSQIPDNQESTTRWMCDQPGCDYDVALTAREKDAWIKSDDHVRRGPGSGKQTVFWCEQCEKFTVVRAKKDKQTGVRYFPKDSKGNKHLSPSMQERMKNR